MKKIIPLEKNVLIKLEEVDKITESGIILPEKNENEKYQQGQVVSVGESNDINSKIKTGIKVIFEKYEITEIKDGENKFVLLKSKHILAIVG